MGTDEGPRPGRRYVRAVLWGPLLALACFTLSVFLSPFSIGLGLGALWSLLGATGVHFAAYTAALVTGLVDVLPAALTCVLLGLVLGRRVVPVGVTFGLTYLALQLVFFEFGEGVAGRAIDLFSLSIPVVVTVLSLWIGCRLR